MKPKAGETMLAPILVNNINPTIKTLAKNGRVANSFIAPHKNLILFTLADFVLVMKLFICSHRSA